MRKYLLLYILLSFLPMASQGQTIEDLDLSGLPKSTQAKALRYWFDDDDGNVQTVGQLSGKQGLDVSGLIEGLHTLHYQVIDSEDNVAYVRTMFFLKTGTGGASTIKSLRYWFDDDNTNIKNSASAGVQTLDVSTLPDGLHTIHYQVLGNDGKVSYIASGVFLKTGNNFGSETIKASKLIYWFDDETDFKAMNIGEGVQLLDASGLLEGLHTLHYQVLCNNGLITPTMSSIFLRVNVDAESNAAKSLRYWFDDEQKAVEVDIAEGSQLIDASNMIEGLHTVHYQLVDSKGMLGTPTSSVFLKMDANMTSAKNIRYWFDDDATTVKVTGVTNGTQSLDVSNLLTGMHALHYQLTDDNGRLGAPVTRLFIKNFAKVLEGGKNRITQYQYWLNRNSQAMQTVEVGTATNPYQLITLLPMQKESIQSDCFHFEVANNVPTIYAKNILHIRFWDAQGYFSDGEKPFIDYSVKKEVIPVDGLKASQTFQRVAENDIRWYTMQAAPGDTAAFCLSQAATLQVFAPSGKEVFKTSESASVQWSGIHTWEEGTYYVAVHDVTGSQSNMTLNYMHMDKYDVVDWDVHTVGNGGCSTITFKGNGYRDLYAVDLFNAQGDTIKHVYIGHESDATTSIVFDFTGVEFGKYNAIFHFTTEDKRFTNIVTVEEARKIELATTVTYPSTFLRGTSTTYNIKITNKGNMTAYYVPIYTYIKSITQNAITHIEYGGLDLPSIYSQVDLSELSSLEVKELREMEKRVGDAPYFIPAKVAGESNNDSIYIRTGLFFVNVSPNSTKELNLAIQSSEIVDVWVTIPEEWRIMNEMTSVNSRHASLYLDPSIVEDYYCCYKELIECELEIGSVVLDVASYVLMIIGETNPELLGTPALASLAVGLAGCSVSIAGNQLKGFGDALCNSDKDNIKERIIEGLKAGLKSSINISSVISCVGAAITGTESLKLASGTIKVVLQSLGEFLTTGAILNDWRNAVFGNSSCGSIFKKKPGCPPTPPHGGLSNPVNSFDPNEIYGYVAESGCYAVNEERTDLYYTIQFENDTAFATSAAHEIVVCDTLDATKFDLSTYEPTRIKIGEKSAELAGDKNFITTIDMRPEINAIAQVTGTYDEKKGIAKWYITSLDPMTMEPTTYVMDGVLPVNTNGNGIGEVSYNISLKSGLSHGTEIHNRAGIVFDHNETIMTPTWTNVIDAVAPTSHIIDVAVQTDSTATVSIEASDELSGVWRYDVYVQYGTGSAWWKAAENVPAGTAATVKIYEGMNNGFYVVATDSAGNVERKEAMSELSLNLSTIVKGDANYDQAIDVADVVAIVNYILGEPNTPFIEAAADVTGDGKIDVDDIVAVVNIILDSGQQNAREMILILENCGFRF